MEKPVARSDKRSGIRDLDKCLDQGDVHRSTTSIGHLHSSSYVLLEDLGSVSELGL